MQVPLLLKIRAALASFFADMAQSVEHSLGKGEVTSSNLVIGTTFRGGTLCTAPVLLYLLFLFFS